MGKGGQLRNGGPSASLYTAGEIESQRGVITQGLTWRGDPSVPTPPPGLFASDWAAPGVFFRELAAWEKSLGEGLCLKHSPDGESSPKGLVKRAAS